MEIAVVGRGTDISEAFRTLIEEKLEKAETLAPAARRAEVVLTHERNPRLSEKAERIEITFSGKGPAIRAEASAADRVAALDLAFGKLMERLRRVRDRKKNHHVKSAAAVPDDLIANGPVVVAEPPIEPAPPKRVPAVGEVMETSLGDSPVVIREKTHRAHPMSVDDALYEMELIGHDFYLFVDSETALPAVVYRRRGWSYGVIRLDAPVVSTVDADAS